MKSARLAGALRIAGPVLFSLLAAAAWGQQVVRTVTTAANPTQIVVNPAIDKWFAALGTSGWAMGDGTTGAVTNFPTFGDEIKFGAVNPVTNRVYFVRNNTSSMAVDATTGVNFPSYDLGGTIDGIVVNPVTGHYYMLQKALDQVTWFDASDSGSTSPVTKPAIGAVNGATNTLYFASNAVDATLTKMSGATHLATGSVQMSAAGLAMTVNPVSNKVYVTTASTDLLVFDGTTLVEATPVTVCFGGTAVAVNPDSERVYVVCPGDTVTVVDGATNTVVDTVTVGDLPGAIAVDIVANKVYVANQGDGTVTVIDGADNTTQTVIVGTTPAGIALNPVTGKVFVANSGSSNVSVIDRSTYTQAAGPNSFWAAVNPVTGKAYVANWNGGSLMTVLDGASNATLGTPSVGFGVFTIAIDPVLDKVYATREDGNVVVLDGPTNAFVTAIPVGTTPRNLAVNPVTHRVYVSNQGSHDVSVIEGITNSVIATVPVGNSPQAVAVNPQTNRIFVANGGGGNNVSVIDGATSAVVKTIGVGGSPAAIAVNPVTNMIYVVDNTNNIRQIVGSTIDDVSPVVNSYPFAGNVNDVAVDIPNNKVWVSVFNSNDAAVLDAALGSVTPIPVGGNSNNIAFDPVRNKVYVSKNGAGTIVAIDGASLATKEFGVGSNPQRAAVNPVNGKFYVARAFTPLTIVDPAPTSFTRHKPALISGGIGPFGSFTTSSSPSLTLGTSSLYSSPDPAVQSMRFRHGDSQGPHAPATPLSGPNGSYLANLTGLTKGLNYVSVFALDAMSGSSISSESGGIGASPTITGAPSVIPMVLVDPPVISTTILAGGRFGTPYSAFVAANGGSGGLAFSISGGALPGGLSLMAGSGAIDGTPTADGTFNFTVTVTDSIGASSSRPLSITIDPDVIIVTTPSTSLGFGSQVLTTTSAPQGVTVTMVGTSTLLVGAVTLSGTHPGDFTIASNDCATVISSTSCTIGVTFSPAALGARSAFLYIASNDAATPVKGISLSGTGVAIDDMPDQFTFTDVSGAPRTSSQTSDIITVTGINFPAQISVAGSGGYSIGCTATFTQATSTVVDGDMVCVQHTASSGYNGSTATTLSIGSITGTVSDTFTSTTIAGFTLSVATGGTGSGSVAGTGINCPGDCSEVVDAGTMIVLSATANVGSTFTGWSGGGCSGTGGCSVPVNADTTVTATFALIQYTVTPSAGANGTIAPSTAQTVNHGATTSFTVTPNAGFTAVVGGTCGGSLVGNGYTTNAITANCTVSATFTQVTYTVTPSAGANGTISPSTAQTVGHGATTSFIVTPNANFEIDTVTGCGGSLAGSTYTTGAITASCTVTAAFRTSNPPRLGNISTRMQVLTGNDVMIGGFVIGGSANKTVAIVATGPSLAAFGITNPLANPTLRLVRSSDQATLATNDDWQAAANQADLAAAGFAPTNALEAAILIDLPPGAYTAIVEGAGGGTGVAVVGVYEVDGPTIPLVNISTRGRVLTGNDVMIGGFVVQGSGPQTLAIVATGPSLAAFGITSPLANPSIRLVRSSDQVVVASNDDWQTDANAAQLQAAGFAPTNALESGLHVTLPPGAYTVIVEGVGGGTGVAVIGVYAVN